MVRFDAVSPKAELRQFLAKTFPEGRELKEFVDEYFADYSIEIPWNQAVGAQAGELVEILSKQGKIHSLWAPLLRERERFADEIRWFRDAWVVLPPRPPGSDQIRPFDCNRQLQWNKLLEIAGERAHRIVFLIGSSSEYHQSFVERLCRRCPQLVPTTPHQVIWPNEIPQTPKDYLSSLSVATFDQDVGKDLEKRLGAVVSERRQIFCHPEQHATFSPDMFRSLTRYYGTHVPTLLQGVPEDRGTCFVQPLAWPRSLRGMLLSFRARFWLWRLQRLSPWLRVLPKLEPIRISDVEDLLKDASFNKTQQRAILQRLRNGRSTREKLNMLEVELRDLPDTADPGPVPPPDYSSVVAASEKLASPS